MMMKLTQSKPIWIDSQRPLAQWYSSSLGQSILDRLEVQLQGSLCDVFGYQGLPAVAGSHRHHEIGDVF